MVGHHNVTIQSDSIESSWQIFELTIRDVTTLAGQDCLTAMCAHRDEVPAIR
jgi:hypothetical protein